MNLYIDKIRAAIEPLRQAIIHHKVYSAIRSVEALRVFMQYHVYAVWDFMSLLKSLQKNLTCVEVPWYPKGTAQTRFLINEIVVGEESDVDERGERTSHFELYLAAMQQSGADSSQIEGFVSALQETGDFAQAYARSRTPKAAADFVDFTFEIINSGQAHLQAAIFTFGREDLIPNMFLSIIGELHSQFPSDLSTFKYYIERHIEVDGGHHSHLAIEMTSQLCGERAEYWQQAQAAVVRSLERRLALWDAVYAQLR